MEPRKASLEGPRGRKGNLAELDELRSRGGAADEGPTRSERARIDPEDPNGGRGQASSATDASSKDRLADTFCTSS